MVRDKSFFRACLISMDVTFGADYFKSRLPQLFQVLYRQKRKKSLINGKRLIDCCGSNGNWWCDSSPG
jgi:hypothetical protein